VIEHLNQEFVNVWTVTEELEKRSRDAEGDPAVRAFAAALLADYQYPVDTQLRAPDGSLLRQLAANDLMNDAQHRDMGAIYLEFLRPPSSTGAGREEDPER
jgi:hypothetical protein